MVTDSPERITNSGMMPTTLEIQKFPLWGKLKGKRTPISFDLEITARCNLDCRHCYINLPAGDPAAQAGELTPDEILRIAGDAGQLGALWCLITGGEPLLRPDFPAIYLGLKRLGLLVSVFTNATLVTEEHARLFRRYPPRDIEVTVYGATRQTYEQVTRQPGSFAAFMDGLNLLLDSGVRVRLKAMALRSNLDEMAEISRFCREHTRDYYRFDAQLHLRYDGNPAHNEEIKTERLTPGQIVALERADEKHFTALLGCKDRLIHPEFNRIGSDNIIHCGAGIGSFNVGSDGTFRLCSSLRAEGTTYDLRSGTLAEAWNEFVPRVRDLRSRKREFLESCRKCALVDLCRWCPGHAHLETGEMDGATPDFCAVAHARASALTEIK
jgi:radical SAM protein with 4Fe4S-binding SPASM domain